MLQQSATKIRPFQQLNPILKTEDCCPRSGLSPVLRAIWRAARLTKRAEPKPLDYEGK